MCMAVMAMVVVRIVMIRVPGCIDTFLSMTAGMRFRLVVLLVDFRWRVLGSIHFNQANARLGVPLQIIFRLGATLPAGSGATRVSPCTASKIPC